MRREAACALGLAGRPATRTARAAARTAGALLAHALAALLITATTSAQTPSTSILQRLQQVQGRDQTTPGEVNVPAPTTTLEALVAPDTYRLFAGDELHLGVWGEVPRSFLLFVGPEGDLMLPGKGPLQVAGFTLREAEEAVVTTLRPVYGRTRVTLRLTQQAKVRIMVTGMVAKPGIYEITAADRLSTLLEMAGGIRPGGSLRRILVRPSDSQGGGEGPAEVDLLPWMLHGEIGSNPFLAPGRRVEVPTQGPAVRIRGPVFSRSALQTPVAPAIRVGDRPEEEPDLYIELRPGDTVGLLLDQVGGSPIEPPAEVPCTERATPHSCSTCRPRTGVRCCSGRGTLWRLSTPCAGSSSPGRCGPRDGSPICRGWTRARTYTWPAGRPNWGARPAGRSRRRMVRDKRSGRPARYCPVRPCGCRSGQRTDCPPCCLR